MNMLIAVTNRHLCRGDFLEHIEKIARSRPDALILREKDLTPEAYQRLARTCSDICETYGVQFIAHSFVNVALNMGLSCLQLAMSPFIAHHRLVWPGKENPKQDWPPDTGWEPYPQFSRSTQSMHIGVSVHSTKDAITAERYGASYVVAGHIFVTDSKKGSPPRGLAFLEDVCGSVTIPVYAIGGITPDNIHHVMDTGTRGVCVMSPFMTAPQPEEVVAAYRKSIDSWKGIPR